MKRLSHSCEVRVGLEVSTGSIEVTGRDEGECAFETNENQDVDDVGADGADEHDEIEDCHEQDEVS